MPGPLPTSSRLLPSPLSFPLFGTTYALSPSVRCTYPAIRPGLRGGSEHAPLSRRGGTTPGSDLRPTGEGSTVVTLGP